MDKNKVIIDWLSFTSQIHTENDIVEMLGMTGVSWENIKGAQGYMDRLYYDKCSVHYHGRSDMGVWCELSGQGCRNFETFGSGSYDALFSEIKHNRDYMNITRIDIAYDDFDGFLDINTICEYVRNQNYVSPMRDWSIELSSKGSCIVIGSRKSDVLIRIYDKAAERKRSDIPHWVRCELQLRRKRAEFFAFDERDIGTKYIGVLNNYLRFVEPVEDSNKSRWSTSDWWIAFLDDLSRISIYEKPGIEYNLDSLDSYVIGQAGNSIYTFVRIFGKEKLFDRLKERGSVLSERQRALISRYENSLFNRGVGNEID